MKRPVNYVAHQFALPCCPEPPRLQDGLINTDKDFPMDTASIATLAGGGTMAGGFAGCEMPSAFPRAAVVKSDDVCWPPVPQILLVHLGYFSPPNQMNAHLPMLQLEQIGQQDAGRTPQQAQVNGPVALSISQEQYPARSSGLGVLRRRR